MTGRDLTGQQVGRFRIERMIGSGGMGTVYEATDVFLGRPVALKVLTPLTEALDDARERFFREARAVARLEHPNIVRIYEADSNPESPYIAMELIRGGDIKQLLASPSPPSRGRLLELAAQVFEGLGHAHAHGVIHRDVKPANILLTPEGTVKLIDFGLARLHDDDRDLTRGQVFGSASYMAPEQIMDPRTIDYRADIYSAGVLLHQLVTGRVPHQAATVAETLVKVVHADVPDPRDLVHDLDPALVQLILGCLSRNRDDRPGSAAEIAQQLRDLVHDTTYGRATSTRVFAPPTSSRAEPSLHQQETVVTWPRETEPPTEEPARHPAPPLPVPTVPEAPAAAEATAPVPRDLGSFELTTAVEPSEVAVPTLLPPPTSPGSRRVIAAVAGVALGVLLASAGTLVFLRRGGGGTSAFPLPKLPTPGAIGTDTTPRFPTPSLGTTTPGDTSTSALPLRLVAISPSPAQGMRVNVGLGQTLDFRVQVEGTPQQPHWTLNDDPVADGTSYYYRPTKIGKRDLVSVTVGDPGSDRFATLSWYVTAN